jgi:hypothetical protein
MKTLVTIAFVVWCFALISIGLPTASAAKSSRFTVGQTYLVVWSCFPTQPQPCYVEALTVKVLHDDGWLDVRDEVEAKATGKDNTYTVNPAQMIGFSVKPPTRVASR